MSFTIERLQSGDIARFRAMNALFAAVFEDPENYAAAPPSDAYVETLLRNETVFPLVAIEQGEIIGALVAYDLVKFEQARSEIYIYDLAVAETHRRQGVATGLIRRLREIAAERGAWVLYVQADYGDEPAIALYTKLGRREDVMHFDIDPAK
jgi:aminoglycoside 3-N-acetyltransferase I